MALTRVTCPLPSGVTTIAPRNDPRGEAVVRNIPSFHAYKKPVDINCLPHFSKIHNSPPPCHLFVVLTPGTMLKENTARASMSSGCMISFRTCGLADWPIRTLQLIRALWFLEPSASYKLRLPSNFIPEWYSNFACSGATWGQWLEIIYHELASRDQLRQHSQNWIRWETLPHRRRGTERKSRKVPKMPHSRWHSREVRALGIFSEELAIPSFEADTEGRTESQAAAPNILRKDFLSIWKAAAGKSKSWKRIVRGNVSTEVLTGLKRHLLPAVLNKRPKRDQAVPFSSANFKAGKRPQQERIRVSYQSQQSLKRPKYRREVLSEIYEAPFYESDLLEDHRVENSELVRCDGFGEHEVYLEEERQCHDDQEQWTYRLGDFMLNPKEDFEDFVHEYTQGNISHDLKEPSLQAELSRDTDRPVYFSSQTKTSFPDDESFQQELQTPKKRVQFALQHFYSLDSVKSSKTRTLSYKEVAESALDHPKAPERGATTRPKGYKWLSKSAKRKLRKKALKNVRASEEQGSRTRDSQEREPEMGGISKRVAQWQKRKLKKKTDPFRHCYGFWHVFNCGHNYRVLCRSCDESWDLGITRECHLRECMINDDCRIEDLYRYFPHPCVICPWYEYPALSRDLPALGALPKHIVRWMKSLDHAYDVIDQYGGLFSFFSHCGGSPLICSSCKTGTSRSEFSLTPWGWETFGNYGHERAIRLFYPETDSLLELVIESKDFRSLPGSEIRMPVERGKWYCGTCNTAWFPASGKIRRGRKTVMIDD
ncbi:hypothetical protein BCR34DRAFT_556476 [Clohesyomyces aquaticus]|uniref:Uncharacterized protein n=1 Tax=Clohesyomyces aquaticus TaxID=1231657 RepID=A0A1Y2A2I4_9PLEO|nr:hypothetical protein BCR34DRAFT_556476 [Clohesyomyces aquaticus]